MKDLVTISILTYAHDQVPPRRNAWRIVAALFIALHPFMFHFGAFVTWLLAWIALGRSPVPMVDDPGNFDGLVRVARGATSVALVFWFITAFLAVALMVALFGRFRDIARLLAAMGCSYAIAVALLMWDPIGIICWYFD